MKSGNMLNAKMFLNAKIISFIKNSVRVKFINFIHSRISINIKYVLFGSGVQNFWGVHGRYTSVTIMFSSFFSEQLNDITANKQYL